MSKIITVIVWAVLSPIIGIGWHKVVGYTIQYRWGGFPIAILLAAATLIIVISIKTLFDYWFGQGTPRYKPDPEPAPAWA
jgi:hypothetical protein